MAKQPFGDACGHGKHQRILEEDFEIILVNARHIKNVPGHKADKKDSAWIAKLLLSGLLKGSFIPPRPIRELRDLFRYRKKNLQVRW
ncbi:MAG: transposase [Bacteroidetes bacterium]|nr:transposase [Bacteroidota bacterium]